MPPVQNEFDLDSSSVSTATEKNFASALADMNTGDVMEFGGDDDYEYMLNGGSIVNFVPGAYSNLVVTFDWLSRRAAFLETFENHYKLLSFQALFQSLVELVILNKSVY